MATRDTYTTQTWEDLPSETTPVSAERLGHIEDGIKTAMDNRALKGIYDDTGANIGTQNNIDSAGQYVIAGNGNNLQNGTGILVSGANNHIAGGNHACFGYENELSGANNFSSGAYNNVGDANASALGLGLIAKSTQHVTGKFNIEDTECKFIEIVGNGNGNNYRSNAYTLDLDGNAEYAGTVKSSGLILTDTETGTKYKLQVANGALSITEAGEV